MRTSFLWPVWFLCFHALWLSLKILFQSTAFPTCRRAESSLRYHGHRYPNQICSGEPQQIWAPNPHGLKSPLRGPQQVSPTAEVIPGDMYSSELRASHLIQDEGLYLCTDRGKSVHWKLMPKQRTAVAFGLAVGWAGWNHVITWWGKSGMRFRLLCIAATVKTVWCQKDSLEKVSLAMECYA